ncbi:MAG TPA: DUF1565 domain-containing protein [Candidatus Cloacimonetes bacterium]|nr:DUF1565 domain-containing protein [Candidatus Cloacimonadota bacterium]
MNDIWVRSSVDIILNIFTLDNPNFEFIDNHEDAEYTFSCQQSAIEQIPTDLYVSTEGSDENSGLTPEEPLKTISYANILIKADSLDPRNIYVADGLYSTLQTGEHLPINLKSYVSFIGESEENTIIDGDEYYPIMSGWDGEREVGIKNFTFQNCKLASHHWAPLTMMFTIIDDIWKRFSVTLENLTIKNTTPRTSDDGPRALELVDGDNIEMKNISITDNTCGAAVHLWTMNLNAENFIVNNTQYSSGSESSHGNGLILLRHNSLFADDNPDIIKNLLLCDNISISDFGFPALTFSVAGGCEAYVINGTITENYQQGMAGGIIRVDSGSDLSLINSIVHNNVGGHPVYLNGDDVEFTVDHCLFTNGYEDLFIVGDPVINWEEGNIEGDPLFNIDGDYPFALMELSPCIDAGTLNLPEGIELPEFDLAGNPRIVGVTIDMGAYEYQDSVSVSEEPQVLKYDFLISNFPNPFKSSTKIKLELKEEAHVQVEVYNIKGQKVRTLMDVQTVPGKFELIWCGKDESDKKVASGTYFYKLIIDGEDKAYRNMVLLH